MDYRSYLNYLLNHNDLIYIDTSTLMNVEAMEIFLERAEDDFINQNKRMIVTQSVQKELNKHIRSDNESKRNQARSAILLLTRFERLFIIEEENAAFNNATFADSDLLSRLTLNKATATQLLVTYDRALASDAYNLNEQGSNKGGKVMVCHINRACYIKKCDCVNIPGQDNENVPAEPEVIVKEKIIYIDKPVEHKSESKTYPWKVPVAIVTGFASGVAFEKFAIPFIKKALLAA